MDLEERLRTAVARAYAAAGVRLQEHHIASLARVYSAWAADADAGVADRIERALATSLGVRTA